MKTLALLIFLAVYIGIAWGKIHRSILAIIGAILMIFLKILPQEKAFTYVDWNVIFLLVGMMIIVNVLGKTGALQYIAIKSAKIARGEPVKIMLFLTLITALFSAFLDNVTTIIIMAPITILIAVELGISPLPFLISEVLASNIGGTATLIGDPPNIMIGSAAGLGFLTFLYNLAPWVGFLVLILLPIMWMCFRHRIKVSNERKARIMEFDEREAIQDEGLLKKVLLIFSLVVIGFFLQEPFNIEVATIALGGAFLLLLVAKESPLEVFQEIEWSTIFFFIGFFILVGGLEEVGIIEKMAEKLILFTRGNFTLTALTILWGAGSISAVLDNIPTVATLIPIISRLEVGFSFPATALWWSLALGACLGGNGTLTGAAANVVVADISERNGYPLSFREFTRYGLWITLLNLLLSSLYVWLRYLVGHGA